MTAKKPTFLAARDAILDLYTHGIVPGAHVKRALKVPQVILPTGDVLYFRPQAVYLNAHSTWLDIREMTAGTFVDEIQARIDERRAKEERR